MRVTKAWHNFVLIFTRKKKDKKYIVPFTFLQTPKKFIKEENPKKKKSPITSVLLIAGH